MSQRKALFKLEPNKRILEIGPLDSPMLKKAKADVYYADIFCTQSLKDRYRHDAAVDVDSICEVDFVIHGSYRETFQNVEGFDYIISSHVLEHVPRLIEHFQDIIHVLNPGGRMCILLPDCRYCFDHFRNPTSFSEIYYIHTQRLPFAPWQILDSSNMYVPLNDPQVFATHKRLFHLLAQRNPFARAKEKFERALAGEHSTGHYSAFTPASFLLLLHEMTRAGVFPYTLADFFPTPKYNFTFGAVLEACPVLPDSLDLTEQEVGKLRREMVRLVDYEEAIEKYSPDDV